MQKNSPIFEEEEPRNRKAPQLKELFRQGLPTLRFETSRGCENKSKHDPIDASCIGELVILKELSANATLESFSFSSSFLGDSIVCTSRTVYCGKSHGVRFEVNRLLNDVIRLLGQDVNAFTILDCPVPFIGYPSLVMVYFDSKPAFPVLTKRPQPGADYDGTDIMDDKRVLGELYDYLTVFEEFYGVTGAFGVLTTLSHWKVVWLPKANSLAGARSVPAVPVANSLNFLVRAALGLLSLLPSFVLGLVGQGEAPSGGGTQQEPAEVPPRVAEQVTTVQAQAHTERSLCTTKIYRHDDAELIRVLMSAVKKAWHGRFTAVSLLSHERSYMVLLPQKWYWLHPTVQEAFNWNNGITAALLTAPAAGAEFVVLQYFECVAYFKVWLAVVRNTELMGSLCIIKQVESAEAAQRERELWWIVNGCNNVSCRKVCGEDSIVMPLVFLAEDEIHFEFDPIQCALQTGVIPGDMPARLVDFANAARALAERSELLRPHAVAADVISRMAALGVCHSDLEWRHIALVPVFDAAGQLVDLRPGVIDFGMMEEGLEPAAALVKMQQRLVAMAKNNVL